MIQNSKLCLSEQMIRYKQQFQKYCNLRHKSNHSVSNSRRKQRWNPFFLIEIDCETIYSNCRIIPHQFHPNEHLSSYPVTYYSCNGRNLKNPSTSRNRYSTFRCSLFRSPSLLQSSDKFRSRYRYRIREINSN